MTGQTMTWRERLHTLLPTRHTLSVHPWLQPVATRLLDPRLWRFQEEAVARGVAIGAFWAFVIPFAQMPVAAVHCSCWRGNIPAAAAVTMLTNPLTIGFWLWLAYQLGAFVLGEPAAAPQASGGGAASWLAAFGWPTVLGMGLLAFASATLGYASVRLVWRLRKALRRWLRRRR